MDRETLPTKIIDYSQLLSDTGMVSLPQKTHLVTLLSRPQNFCFSTSCSISCPDSGQPPVSSVADFHPPAAADAAVPLRPDRRISSSNYKKWLQKCPSFGRLPRRGCWFRPVSAQTKFVLRYSGPFHGDVLLWKMEERPETSV